jgi:hypothetical protein
MRHNTLDAIENLAGSLTPDGIDRLKVQKRSIFLESDMLPIEFNIGTKESLESFGVIFCDKVDDLFYRVELPPDWLKKPKIDIEWSCLIDDSGRKRATIFYNGSLASGGPIAFVNITPVFLHSLEPISKFGIDSECGKWHYVIRRADLKVWVSNEIEPEPWYKSQQEKNQWTKQIESFESKAIQWLDTNYPEWKNETAYWDNYS